MGKPRLLLIEDDALTARAFSRVLSRQFEVELTPYTTGALVAIAVGASYDAILYDVNARIMSGRDFYERVMARSADLAARVVIYTGEETADDDVLAKRLGDRYVLKIGPVSELVATLQRVAMRSAQPSRATG